MRPGYHPPPPGADDLAAFRDRHGLTNAQIARALGVSGATVTDWTRGKKCPEPGARREQIQTFTTEVDGDGNVLRPGIDPTRWDRRTARGARVGRLRKVKPFVVHPAIGADSHA